jgi:hypothetical protein
MEKGQKWNDMVQSVNKLEVSDPIVANSSFACTMNMNVTMKNKEDMNMTELCAYQVKDGKIVAEQFYM